MKNKLTHNDVIVLARTIYGEARGESALGQRAVAWVVRNRAEKYGLGLAEAALKSVHFSAWNNARENDANQLAMMLADLTDRDYASCLIEAACVAHGMNTDPTHGATHYHAQSINPPAWALGKPYISIGSHRFYRDID